MGLYSWFQQICYPNESDILANYLADHSDKTFEKHFEDYVIPYIQKQIESDAHLIDKISQNKDIGPDDRMMAIERVFKQLTIPTIVAPGWQTALEELSDNSMNDINRYLYQLPIEAVERIDQDPYIKLLSVKTSIINVLFSLIKEGVKNKTIMELAPLPTMIF